MVHHHRFGCFGHWPPVVSEIFHETMSKICSNRQFFLPAHLIVTRIQHRDRSNPVGEVIPPFDDSVWETDAHLLVALFGERIFPCVLVNAPVPVPHGVNMVAQTRT